MSNIAVVVENLVKHYGECRAVNNISFQVKEGDIFGLLGPNGAGKTTTFSMLTGLIHPTDGKLELFGMNFSASNSGLKRMIGVVPQHLALYPSLTALDNLRFFGRIYGLKGSLLEKNIHRVLEIVGLSDRARHVVNTYSGGMKRRLNMAIALINNPRILFLDEPTVGVDPQSRNAIFEAITKLNNEGMTVIYTTHYMEEAERLCNKIAIMDEGKIIAIDSPEALCKLVGEGFFRAGVLHDDLTLFVDALKKIETINAIRVNESVLEIEAHPLQKTLMQFMEAVSHHGVRLTSLNIYESNLETVFLKLTGKRIRDDVSA
jgi:ABC-2 type transport system ATP-binding protein